MTANTAPNNTDTDRQALITCISLAGDLTVYDATNVADAILTKWHMERRTPATTTTRIEAPNVLR